MHNKKTLFFISILIVLGVILAACQTETIIETVVVEKEVEVLSTVEVEVEVPGGGQLVTLTARCKGSPPYENGRCDNLTKAVGAANAALAEAGDDRRIDLITIMDDADWGDYKTEFELSSEAFEAPDIIVSGH